MKNHQIIFVKIRKLLSKQFEEEVNLYEEDSHLSIGESGIWISMNEDELTIGYGINHRHYHHEYDEIKDAIDEFFNLLTRDIRITKYYKGKYQYKIKAEIQDANGEFKELSTSMTWLYPYWKKVNIKIEIIEKLISRSKIENQIMEIKALVRKVPTV